MRRSGQVRRSGSDGSVRDGASEQTGPGGKYDPPLQLVRFGEMGEGRLVILGIIRLVILY
jgi:hypothetical protein